MTFQWSWSAIEAYDQCPKKFYHKYVLREKEPPSPALEKGRAVHDTIDAFLKDKPADLYSVPGTGLPLIERVRQISAGKKLSTELKMGITQDLQPCAFFDKEKPVWGRCATDVTILDYPNALLVDWKTGKVREKKAQLAIQALFTFKHFPKIMRVTAFNAWLEAGKFGEMYVFERTGESAGWLAICAKIAQIEKTIAANVFACMPSPLCAWCPVKSCIHNRS